MSELTGTKRILCDAAVTLGLLGASSALCVLLRPVGDTEIFVPLVFVLCVLLISRLTNGYVFGIIASLIAVLCVNYVFTYPYMAFNFTISGYPVTFVTMLTVSVTTSTLTTHIKKQEQIKLESEREKMRANLLRAVSHDLRTPLTSIGGCVGAVLEDETMPPEHRRELLESVRDDAEWLVRVVENLLSVTRMYGEGSALVKSPEAAEEVVSESVQKFRKRFPDIAVRVSVPEDVLFIPMDPVLVVQVLTNLMENAALHGNGVTQIRLLVTKEGGSAVFSVKDNGEGISRERMPRLFTDALILGGGEKADNGRRSMGIGLSVCMTIVKAHGGSMTARNLPEGGALLTFALPLE